MELGLLSRRQKKAEKKTKKKKGKKVTITVGSSVKLTGNYYTNGKKILAKDKKKNFESQ